MADVGPSRRTAEEVQRDIESERAQLAEALAELRAGLGEATNLGARLRGRLPVLVAGVLALGFVLGAGMSRRKRGR